MCLHLPLKDGPDIRGGPAQVPNLFVPQASLQSASSLLGLHSVVAHLCSSENSDFSSHSSGGLAINRSNICGPQGCHTLEVVMASSGRFRLGGCLPVGCACCLWVTSVGQVWNFGLATALTLHVPLESKHCECREKAVSGACQRRGRPWQDAHGTYDFPL